MAGGVDRMASQWTVTASSPALQFTHLLGANAGRPPSAAESAARAAKSVADELGAAPLGGDRRRVRRGAAALPPTSQAPSLFVLVRREPGGKLVLAPPRLGDDPAGAGPLAAAPRPERGGSNGEIVDRYCQMGPGPARRGVSIHSKAEAAFSAAGAGWRTGSIEASIGVYPVGIANARRAAREPHAKIGKPERRGGRRVASVEVGCPGLKPATATSSALF